MGLGTGSLQDSYEAVVAAGGQFGKPVKFAMPNDLVELALEHDRMCRTRYGGQGARVETKSGDTGPVTISTAARR